MKLKLKTASSCEKFAYSLYENVFNFDTEVKSADEVEKELKKMCDSISTADSKYKLMTVDDWKKWIEQDWTNSKEYISEHRDCENYAFYFASRVAWLFRVNSAFVAFGDIYSADTGDQVGRHAFNVLFTKDDGLYLYDPMEGMDDEWTKIEDGTIIKDWDYKPTWILGF